jgi:hypothetical protein
VLPRTPSPHPGGLRLPRPGTNTHRAPPERAALDLDHAQDAAPECAAPLLSTRRDCELEFFVRSQRPATPCAPRAKWCALRGSAEGVDNWRPAGDQWSPHDTVGLIATPRAGPSRTPPRIAPREGPPSTPSISTPPHPTVTSTCPTAAWGAVA